MSRSIILPRGQTTLVDDEDFQKFGYEFWQLSSPTRPYVSRKQKIGLNKYKTIYLHRAITNALPGQSVDHIDHDTLNNTKANLRVGTQSQNGANARKSNRGTSKYKGVYWMAARKCWNAVLIHQQRKRYGGQHSVEEDAAKAYDRLARLYFGEFALLNFPVGGSSNGRTADSDSANLSSNLSPPTTEE